MSLLNFFGMERLSPPPSDDFWYGAAGTQTAAGVRVDEGVAMTYSACWAATRLIAGTGGWLPFNLYKKQAGGGSDIARTHRLHRILHDEPNRDMASMSFRTRGIGHQVNHGNTFSEIEFTQGNEIAALHPIHPSRVPFRNIVRENGRLVYYVNNDDGSKTRLQQFEMFHVPSIMTDDGIYGRGVVENARLSIGFGIATETQGASYMGNSARPSIVIEGGKFKDKQEREEYRRMWQEVHGGPANNAKPALLPPESKLHALSFSAEDSQFLQTRQHNIEEIARWYGVPPHMIGHLLRSTYNNIEHQGIEFVQYCLLPWLKLWEQEVWRKLLTKQEQNEGYYAKFVVDALERGDKASRTASNVQEFFNGHLTLNQWAERDDMNPIGPLGDLHFVQQAMVPLEIAAQGPQADAKPDDSGELSTIQDALAGVATVISDLRQELTSRIDTLANQAETQRLSTEGIAQSLLQLGTAQQEHTAIITQVNASLASQGACLAVLQTNVNQQTTNQQNLATAMLRDVMSRMVSLEVNAIKRVAEKPSRFDARLREFYDKHTATLKRELAGPVAACLAVGGGGRDPIAVVESLATLHVTESLKQLDALLDCKTDELSSRVEQCVSKWHDERTGVDLEGTGQ